ncbi:MAG: NAD(P)/FAD-dependent oxidoreductase, partial [Bacteroidales bacterium]|nr:NAD(P)/FAD-dependent oxidoreductase [Bacteroidales bacterium]
MIKEINIKIPAKNLNNSDILKAIAAEKTVFHISTINHIDILKKSLDARSKEIFYQLKVTLYTENDFFRKEDIHFDFKNVENAEEIHIIGSGPAGLFAALNCILNGLKPVIFERGKDVSARKYDTAMLNRDGIINSESNYCFGEGGAGTFSDGKLFTRSSKRGDISNILKLFVYHGTNPEILQETHAHIGSDKLPQIIQNIRNTIIHYGGIIRFNSKIVDFTIENQQITQIVSSEGKIYHCKKVVLATGHSANDIYEMLHRKNLQLEAKDFAIGVRIEHPQTLIDQMQYHQNKRPAYLSAASYNFAVQYQNRGIFSFCMCPGGLIIPTTSEHNKLVVNGMSNSQRNSPFANAGLVVNICQEDFKKYRRNENDALAGLFFRDEIEKRFYNTSNSFIAPAQKLYDFINNKKSNSLNQTTYHLGVVSENFHEIFPEI